MVISKENKQLLIFHLLLNLCIALLITGSSYWHIPLASFKDYTAYAGHFLLMQFCVFAFVYFLTLSRYIFYILFPPLFLLFSFIAFWGYTQQIFLTPEIIKVSMSTQWDIAKDLISWQLLVYLLTTVLALMGILYLYKKTKPNRLYMPLLILAIVGIAAFFVTDKLRKNTLTSRLPFSVKRFYYYYQLEPRNYATIDFKPEFENRDIKVVLVLGESVRADHIQLNGYARPTTPRLAERKNLISFPNAYTSHFFTANSLPQILSDESVYDSIPRDTYYSLIDILNKAEIATAWVGNQTPELDYLGFIDSSRIKVFPDPLRSELSFNKSRDEVLLPAVDSILSPNENQFVIVHMMGSHWWYENKYPDSLRKFTPVIHSKFVPENSPESMINSYDNTIVYLDFFLDQLIDILNKREEEVILIYVSDHGEQLGENGKWLHAQADEKEVVSNPAVMVWYSDQFAAKHPGWIQNFYQIKNKTLPLDFVFPTVLSLYKINAWEAEQQSNLFLKEPEGWSEK